MKELQVGDKVRVHEDLCRGKVGVIDRVYTQSLDNHTTVWGVPDSYKVHTVYRIRSLDGWYMTMCPASNLELLDDPPPRPGDWVRIVDGKEPRKGFVIRVRWDAGRRSHTVLKEDGVFGGWFAPDQLQILKRLPEEWEPEGVEIRTLDGEILEAGLAPIDVDDEALDSAKQHATRLGRAVVLYHCRGYGIELEVAQPAHRR